MQQMSGEEYRGVIARSTVIERDGYGEKVLLTDDGYMVKIFRTKRRLSSAVLRPYAVRFAANARRLAKAGVPSVQVDRLCYCRAARRHLVFYRPLPGRTLRQCLAETPDRRSLLERFAIFLADLHRRGVYFRSIHFGNVLVTNDHAMALIDVADMAVRSSALGTTARARNFKHFFRYQEDVAHLLDYGLASFVRDYLQAARLPAEQEADLRGKLKMVLSDYPQIGE